MSESFCAQNSSSKQASRQARASYRATEATTILAEYNIHRECPVTTLNEDGIWTLKWPHMHAGNRASLHRPRGGVGKAPKSPFLRVG